MHFYFIVELRGIRNPVSTWRDHHLPHAVQQINFVIRLLIVPVECWSIPLQWLCEFACSCQKLKHAVVHADVAHHARTGRFHASRNCVQILEQAKRKTTPVQSAWGHQLWAFGCSSLLQPWSWRACSWASLRRLYRRYRSLAFVCQYYRVSDPPILGSLGGLLGPLMFSLEGIGSGFSRRSILPLSHMAMNFGSCPNRQVHRYKWSKLDSSAGWLGAPLEMSEQIKMHIKARHKTKVLHT